MLIAALLAVAVAAEPPPYRGVPTFSIGMAGTRLSLVQHADNSLVLRASDAYGSVACAPYDAQVWPKYRAFFAQIAAGQLHDMDRAVEDTSTYSKKVITAHTDLSLFVLVLDAWKETGALATNTVVESAYRVRDIIKDESSEFFFRVLGRFGRGDTAASIVVKLQACGEATPPAQCLDEHAEGK